MASPRLIGAALALGMAVSGAQAQTLELKFGHVGQPGSLFEYSVNKFVEIANARLGDRAQVTAFGSSQLGKDKQMMQKLLLGTLDLSLPSSVMSSVVDEFGLFEMPYLVKSRAHMAKIEKEIFWPTLEPLLEKKGYKVIAVFENGFRHITNNVRPIYKPADLAGIKLRTPKGKWRVKMFQLYGANPTPMAFSEVFTALQTGTIDGQENPYAQIYSGKFQEVQKYLSITGHVYTPAYVTVGLKRWNSLPEDVRNDLIAAGKEAQPFVYAEAARLETDLLAKIKAAGVAVNEADKAAFIAASKPIYDEFGKEVAGAAEMIRKAQALAN